MRQGKAINGQPLLGKYLLQCVAAMKKGYHSGKSRLPPRIDSASVLIRDPYDELALKIKNTLDERSM
ncbi:hypothetical protein Mal52_13710 [Symmachiella dynata]|uniref:Uncharacterized protein n=1 Tax=Symmachiella dynata TaxID=2527995 RepID=A0A517ZK75_9PLAN|nr:hypothetical protein [Symmachiella dynata]QDU42902.1 hypothetical protein Mal52_13710 [Symmachiella dynata]